MADLLIRDGVGRPNPFDAGSTDFVSGYENPVKWHETFRADKDLMDYVERENKDNRDVRLVQYDGVKPEFIKWSLFGYNLIIAYVYISKEKLEKALETIHETENILSSISKDDPFLKSIKIALNHITYSLKGYVLKLCEREISLEHFIMPDKMNNVNKAALYGVQAIFFSKYGIICSTISKECALKAISLNDIEAEWHFVFSKVITRWHNTCTLSKYSKEEIDAAEKAVSLGNKNSHKLHLAVIYQRMSRGMGKKAVKTQILDAAFKLLNEVRNDTNDLFLLSSCFRSLAKIAPERTHVKNEYIQGILDQLLVKLKSNDHVNIHRAIGNYYLFNKKDYVAANNYLKKAYDAKSFSYSIDYILTFYKMDADKAPVEQMLVGMLKTFLHPVHQEQILSHIVSYLIMTKNDLIQALEYVPKLLSIKDIKCVSNIQIHRTKYTQRNMTLNLLDVLSEKLDVAMNDPTLSTEHKKKVKKVMQILERYQNDESILMKNKEQSAGQNYKMDSLAKNDLRTFKHESFKQNVKNNDEGNWRTLKPDSKLAFNIFSRNKQTSSSGMDFQSRYNHKN